MVRFAVRLTFAPLFFGLWASVYAGTSDPAGIAGGIFAIMVGGVLLFVLGTVVGAALLFKGKLRIPAILVTVVFWGWLYQIKIAMPVKASTEETNFGVAARRQCESDLANLEASYPVDGVLDEAASLRKGHILQLLAERKLNFIEFKVQQFERGQPRIAYADSEGENSWAAPQSGGSFVRVELGKIGDPRCDKDLTYGTEGKTQKPPFLPNTCVKTSFSDGSTARYAIAHKPGGHTANSKYNDWQLVDRQQNKVLARLTTIDQPVRASSGRDLSTTPAPSLSDCRSPHTLLADRLVGTDQTIEGHPQLVSIKTVVASVPPKILEAQAISDPKLSPRAEAISVSSNGYGQIFHAYSEKDGWLNAVSQAQRTGWGVYDSQLLDWKNRQLITLRLDYPWIGRGVNDGFWVWSTGSNWYGRPDNLLARYAADGKLTWTASVVGTQAEVFAGGCTMVPRAIGLDASDVLIYSPCHGVQSGSEGLVWRIKQNTLPKNSAPLLQRSP